MLDRKKKHQMLDIVLPKDCAYLWGALCLRNYIMSVQHFHGPRCESAKIGQ